MYCAPCGVFSCSHVSIEYMVCSKCIMDPVSAPVRGAGWVSHELSTFCAGFTDAVLSSLKGLCRKGSCPTSDRWKKWLICRCGRMVGACFQMLV